MWLGQLTVRVLIIIVHNNPVIVSDQVIEAHVLHLAASLRIIIVDEIRLEDLGRLGITFLELAQLGVAQESAFSLVRPRGINPLSDNRFFTKVVTQK